MQKITAMDIFSMQITGAFLLITGAFISIWVTDVDSIAETAQEENATMSIPVQNPMDALMV